MTAPERTHTWMARPGGIAFGGDYNPEQWSEEIRRQDLDLMRTAGVNLVTVGVFAWALLEPVEGRYELDWLEAVVDDLHGAGISVDLATATASPPPWFSHAYPETMLQQADGTRLWPGGRQNWCPSSPVFREKSLALVEELGARFGAHPGVVLWHVSNELGCHNAWCYCDVSADAFRRWLEHRYGDLATLNDAWATNFWSQRYSAWEEIVPPRLTPAFANPTQQLDFRRFSSDELLAQFTAEREVLARHSPGIPVTTNFMVMPGIEKMDFGAWGPHMDLVSNDHYTNSDDPRSHVELAFSADLTRGTAGGAPWLLMESSTSAVSWQPRNRATSPGELQRRSLQHLARGADGICFFQWRASKAGSEKYHSSLVPHAGTDSRVWREAVALGQSLQALDEVAGSRVAADVAIVVDWDSRWAVSLDSHPSVDVGPLDEAHLIYGALWDRNVTADIVGSDADLEDYRLVIVPTLYLVSDHNAARLEEYVRRGGTVVVTYFSGIVDENDHVRLGGYPGAFREMLGIRVEEFFPLQAGESVRLDDGTTATRWTELLHLEGAKPAAHYVDGPLSGIPAVTRHDLGEGTAWYIATRLDEAAMGRFVQERLRDLDIEPLPLPPGVEVVRRVGDSATYLFVINHTEEPVDAPVTGFELLTSQPCDGTLNVPAGEVRVVRIPGSHSRKTS